MAKATSDVTSGIPGKGKTADFKADGGKTKTVKANDAATETKVHNKEDETVAQAATSAGQVATIDDDKPNGRAVEVMDAKTGELVTAGDDDLFEGVTGLENVTARDLLIPRLTILQALSPQTMKTKPEFIDGCEQGDFCDTALGETFKDLLLLPVWYARIFLEWAPRNKGIKGPVHNHGMDGSILEKTSLDDKKRNVLPNGNIIAETATFYLMNMSAHGRKSFLPMASTQLKHARKWLTAVTSERIVSSRTGQLIQPPLFYRTWRASTILESNAEGSWFGWKFDPGPRILDLEHGRMYAMEGKEFAIQAAKGLIQGDLTAEDLIPTGEAERNAEQRGGERM